MIPNLVLWYVAFLMAVTLHEAGHAWAAWRGGDETAYLGGQVSLNPMPHIVREPIGTILVPLISFFFFDGSWMIGWASAPYDPSWAASHPRRSAWMALCGPLANLVLLFGALIALKVGMATGTWIPNFEGLELDHLVAPMGEGGGVTEGLGRFLSIVFSLNAVLFFFNLIPFPPLDGAAILRGGFPGSLGRFYEWLDEMPGGTFIGLILAWTLFPKFFLYAYQPLLWMLFSL